MENLIAALIMLYLGGRAAKKAAYSILCYTAFDYSVFGYVWIYEAGNLLDWQFYSYHLCVAIIAAIGSIACMPRSFAGPGDKVDLLLSLSLLVVSIFNSVNLLELTGLEWLEMLIYDNILLYQIFLSYLRSEHGRAILYCKPR